MSWIPLSERFSSLPLILAGPVVRRVEPQSVTVWLALKEPCTVTLRVYVREDTAGLVRQCEGTRHTIRLGDYLHLVAVTASTKAAKYAGCGSAAQRRLAEQPESRRIDRRLQQPGRDLLHLDGVEESRDTAPLVCREYRRLSTRGCRNTTPAQSRLPRDTRTARAGVDASSTVRNGRRQSRASHTMRNHRGRVMLSGSEA